MKWFFSDEYIVWLCLLIPRRAEELTCLFPLGYIKEMLHNMQLSGAVVRKGKHYMRGDEVPTLSHCHRVLLWLDARPARFKDGIPVGTVVRDTGLSRTTVNKALRELKSYGMIHVSYRDGVTVHSALGMFEACFTDEPVEWCVSLFRKLLEDTDE